MSTAPVELTLVLGPEAAGILLTPEEFDAVEEFDDGYRYELIHGVLVVNPIPLPQETGPNDLLGHLLLGYKENHPAGNCLDLTLPEQHIRTRAGRRRADRVLWIGLGRTPHIRHDVPAMVVELVSAGRRNRQRDYVEKRQDYLDAGLREYWIIDRFRRTMTVVHYQPEGPHELVVAERETYRTPLLPGFELPLARLLAVADQLEQPE
jgi:Uma2 family endonuclease